MLSGHDGQGSKGDKVCVWERQGGSELIQSETKVGEGWEGQSPKGRRLENRRQSNL